MWFEISKLPTGDEIKKRIGSQSRAGSLAPVSLHHHTTVQKVLHIPRLYVKLQGQKLLSFSLSLGRETKNIYSSSSPRRARSISATEIPIGLFESDLFLFRSGCSIYYWFKSKMLWINLKLVLRFSREK